MSENGYSSATGVIVASTIAGPVFLWVTALGRAYLQLPRTVEVQPKLIMYLLLLTLPALVFGFLLALVPMLFGRLLMQKLGQVSEIARLPSAWAIAGALGGTGLSLLGATPAARPENIFGLIVTGAVCARVCRAYCIGAKT